MLALLVCVHVKLSETTPTMHCAVCSIREREQLELSSLCQRGITTEFSVAWTPQLTPGG